MSVPDSESPANTAIVIAGGGVIGLSVAWHLARAGATNVTLLERNRLTSGTSWHAAGIVGPLRSSQNLTQLASYGIKLFSQLERETGQSTGYQRTGGYWLAQQPQRLLELQRIGAMAELNQLTARIVTAAELNDHLPQLHTEDLSGALWVEEDGQINPVDLCLAYAKGARDAGAQLREHAAVTDIQLIDNKPHKVRVNHAESIDCDIFINCAGLWAAELGKLAGVNIPLQAVEHFYLVTEPVDDLPRPLPILRDLDSDIYIKGDAGKLVIGAFEPNAKLWDPASVAADADYLMFNEDWDHVEPALQSAMHRLPVVADTGIRQYLCGPESFTPDTRQIMGAAAEVQNYYVAAGFNSIGIMSSAGVGKAMADWVLNSAAPMDLWDVDLQRFDPSDSDPAFLSARTPEAVNNQFAMHWPGKQYKTGRNRKHALWHDLLAAKGAVFGAPTGWERPLWHEHTAGATRQTATPRYSYGAQHWWPNAALEAQSLVEYGALFELSPFSKFQITGDDALAFLQSICSRDMNINPGRVAYSLMLNDMAGIEIECTITRLNTTTFFMVGGAATRLRDLTYLRRASAAFTAVTITDQTDDYACVGVMGPASQEVVSNLFTQFPPTERFTFSSAHNVNYQELQVMASRISYVGEYGYELYVPHQIATPLMQQLLGIAADFHCKPAGHYCLDACRLEKNYPHWGHDIGPELNPVEADLSFAANPDKPDHFRGKESLAEQANRPLTKKRVLFRVNAEQPLLLHDEPVYRNGQLIGATTSGGLGFRTDSALSMAIVTAPEHNDAQSLQALLNESAEYHIRLGDERVSAILLTQPPWDAERQRLLNHPPSSKTV
jgi:4-methylaminobutanoate oxidase (formaldehyde-forming)